jgi:hypothetical protein
MPFYMTDYRPEFVSRGAVYEMPPVPHAPHINVIKSDTHTTAYFNSDYAEQHIDLMDEVAQEWATVLAANDLVPDRVIGHAAFAEVPAVSLVRALRQLGHDVLFAYSKQTRKGSYETSFPVRPGERIVVVADDIVTGSSTISTAEDARSKGGIILPITPCLANLSLRETLPLAAGDNLMILAASIFEPETYRVNRRVCDLCTKLGSKALEPRKGNNWAELQRWMNRAPGPGN